METIHAHSASNISSLSSSKAFRLEDQSKRWGVPLWTLTLDLQGEKVNKLGTLMIDEFEKLIPQLKSLADQNKIEALVVLSGKPGNFIAGADIKLIQSAKTAQEAQDLSQMGQKLLNRWEDLPFIKVVGIDGAALGGGCEFSLSCDAIVMSDSQSARIGLPEVMLGVIPGMGGCVRLPQKVGIATALDMILSTKMLSGEKAYKSGLAEACLPQQNFAESVQAWVVKNLKALKAGERLAREPKYGGMGGMIGKILEKTPFGRSMIFSQAKKGVLSKTKGQYPAPLEALAAIQSIGNGYGPKFKASRRDKAMLREAQGFGKMAATEVSKNLIRLFFMTEEVKKSNGLLPGTQVKAHEVHMGGVLGAGVMGGGIAQLFADKNIPIRMKDITLDALTLGIQAANRLFKKSVERRKINKREYVQKLNLIAPTLDFEGFKSTDIVIEAVVEKMDIKKKVLADLENHVKDDCVIASNTSSLSISEMQTALKKPERFAGMHFFNPVHKMPLVEVIRGAKTSDEAVASVYELAKKLGKTPVVVLDRPGFLVNRLLGPYMMEAVYLIIDGAPIDEIDRALLKFGMPMGPIELVDEVGVDVADKVSHIFFDAFGERMRGADLNSKLLEQKRLGKKSGKGFYEFSGKDNRDKVLKPEIYSILGVTPKSGSISAEEIIDRCLLPMINEATRCLDEGVVASVSELDLAMIMGTGFPPFKGGLMRYADSLGAKAILEKLEKYHKRFGARFEPCEGVVKRARSDQKYYS